MRKELHPQVSHHALAESICKNRFGKGADELGNERNREKNRGRDDSAGVFCWQRYIDDLPGEKWPGQLESSFDYQEEKGSRNY
jgi:hypothetical protein